MAKAARALRSLSIPLLALLALPTGAPSAPRGADKLKPPATERSDPLPAKRHPRHRVLTVDGFGRPPHPPVAGPITIPDSQIEPIAWSDVDQWPQDNHGEAFDVFRTSCRAVLSQERAGNDARPILPPLAAVCRRALAMKTPTAGEARAFFESNFRPVRIVKLGDQAGFLTGYYEPVVEGSRFPTPVFKVPVYRRPDDLIPPAGYVKGQGFPNTGKSMRRAADGTLVPYYERGDIDNGVFDGRRLEICWLKDPIDLFFIQIQGSGRVRLEDGTILRINYDAHNGHPYTAIGRILIERGQVPREEMSMERIRQWMQQADPRDAMELRAQNKSYVFFRIVGLSGENEPAGAQGVPLTPRRSIAVDKALHVYGTPFFIEAELPISSAQPQSKFRRLMIAQDTGSAIVGPARADLYFGAGEEAGRIAGRFRHPGRFTLLLPRELDPVVAGAAFPLPSGRPDVEAILAQREKEAGAARAQAQAEIPLPRPRPKGRLHIGSRR
ncbi:MAG TPA: MltA domain-containing protein [Xanthobacteraceae bacterium]|nr:MltA domain-containing protein [Xanthobacteraceae bacterium]